MTQQTQTNHSYSNQRTCKRRRAIHTTIDPQIYDFLERFAKENEKAVGQVIDYMITEYQRNKNSIKTDILDKVVDKVLREYMKEDIKLKTT